MKHSSYLVTSQNSYSQRKYLHIFFKAKYNILLIYPPKLSPRRKIFSESREFRFKKKKNIYIHPKGSKEIFKIFYFINTRIYRIPDLLHSKITLSLSLSMKNILHDDA